MVAKLRMSGFCVDVMRAIGLSTGSWVYDVVWGFLQALYACYQGVVRALLRCFFSVA